MQKGLPIGSGIQKIIANHDIKSDLKLNWAAIGIREAIDTKHPI